MLVYIACTDRRRAGGRVLALAVALASGRRSIGCDGFPHVNRLSGVILVWWVSTWRGTVVELRPSAASAAPKTLWWRRRAEFRTCWRAGSTNSAAGRGLLALARWFVAVGGWTARRRHPAPVEPARLETRRHDCFCPPMGDRRRGRCGLAVAPPSS